MPGESFDDAFWSKTMSFIEIKCIIYSNTPDQPKSIVLYQIRQCLKRRSLRNKKAALVQSPDPVMLDPRVISQTQRVFSSPRLGLADQERAVLVDRPGWPAELSNFKLESLGIFRNTVILEVCNMA